MEGMNLKEEAGWLGNFTRDSYEGAIPNGTRIMKQNSKPDDGNQDGTLGTVLGSIGHPEAGIGYFVEWDTAPKTAVFIQDKRIKVAEEKKEFLPDRSNDELNQLAKDLHAGRIFTDRHINNQEDFPHVFMIVGLGGFSKLNKEDVEKIGLVYEYLDKAGPRSVNGMPIFMSIQMLNINDTNKLIEKYEKLRKAEEEALS